MLHSNVALDSSEWNAISGVGEALCVGDGVTSTVSGPVVSTTNPRDAQGPVVPAGLVARTTSTCGPSLRSPAGANDPVRQPTATSSNRHSKDEPGALANANAGRRARVGPSGPCVKKTSGTLVSTVKSRLAHSPAFCRASVARTARRCGPSPSTAVVNGEEQVSGAPPSTLHSRLANGSEAENWNVGVESFVGVGSCGPDSKLTLGPVRGLSLRARALDGRSRRQHRRDRSGENESSPTGRRVSP